MSYGETTKAWSRTEMPSQQGRRALITGTGGLGLAYAQALAGSGCEVIIAGRNPVKGAAAIASIRHDIPSARVGFEQVDLASLQSVEDFGNRLRGQGQSLDLLINNAAIMAPPNRQETEDGFELQLGTNYLSHFAITAMLMPLLREGQDARVVTLSSVAAREGKINLTDLQSLQNYNTMAAYAQSKLACLMFALELQRRSKAEGWGVTSIAAHPGISRTNLLHNAPGRFSTVGVLRSLLWFMFQPAAQGALPILYAATAPEATTGAYYGPDKLGETRGYPAPAKIPLQALDLSVSSWLWNESEKLTMQSF